MSLTRPFIPRWVIRRLAHREPDVEQERRVQRYLYGKRTQVEIIRDRGGQS